MKYYCIGIKGAGMSTLAQILYDLGNEVSGYDDHEEFKYTEEGLKKRNIKIYYGNNHDIDKDTIVTYSVAFKPDHKEIKRVKDLGLKIKSYHEVMGDLTKIFETTSVCGTHGKTTTSLLISHVMQNTIGCNFFVGSGNGYAKKENKYFVVESDEFNRHFLSYYPTNTLLTNIELDHTEIYKDLNDLINTFNTFVNKTTRLLVMYGDDKNIRKLKIREGLKTIYYGFNDENDIVCKNVVLNENGSSFDVYIKGTFYGHFDLPLYGKHMILNALGSIAILDSYNISFDDIHKYIENFKGAKKRFNIKEVGNYVEIDDYAHHPTEIKVTLESARQKYPNKDIIAVFLPNTYSRTKDLMDDFIDVLKLADKTYVFEIESNREKKEDFPLVTSKTIVDNIKDAEMLSKDSINKLLNHENSVICFMSCADIAKYEKMFEDLIMNKNK